MKFFLLLASIVGVFGEFTKSEVQYHRMIYEDYNDFEFIGPPRIKTTFTGRPLAIPHHLRTGEPVVISKNEALKDYRACLQFDYYLNVPESMGLKVVYENAPGVARNFSQVVWSRYGYNGDLWRQAYLDVTLKKGETLIFVGTTDSGSIAFTDLLEFPKNQQMCKYSNVDTDFDAQPLEKLWANADVRSARDILPNLKDHTSGSGFGKVAHLKQASNSRVTAKNSLAKDTKCFTFWYQRPVDKNRQSLTQFAVYANGKEVWRVNDDSAPEGEWLRAIVPLNFEKDGNIISLDVDVNGKEKQVGVLLDDFQFSQDKCPQPVECRFYNDVMFNCGWTNMVFAPHGHTWSYGEGRVQDATLFSENLTLPKTSPTSLLFTDFTERRPSSGIEIQSDFFADKGEHCLELELSHDRVQANDLFTLNHKYQSSGAIKSDVLWTFDSVTAATKHNGTHKAIARIDIPAQAEARRVSLFARSANPYTRFTVHKVLVFDGSCNPSIATTPKPANFVPSKLDKTTLTVADELLKNSKANVERILDLIKMEDPIKAACQKVMTEIDAAIHEIGHNLK